MLIQSEILKRNQFFSLKDFIGVLNNAFKSAYPNSF